jgi:hypothetical protein
MNSHRLINTELIHNISHEYFAGRIVTIERSAPLRIRGDPWHWQNPREFVTRVDRTGIRDHPPDITADTLRDIHY